MPNRFIETRRVRWTVAALVAAIVPTGCRNPTPKPAEKEVVIWKHLGEWSGHGNAQTESFVGLSGALRMRWRTTNESPPGSGRFRLILHSGISGRVLQEPVDETGAGQGIAFAAEDPRAFYMTVESVSLDWSFTVDESFVGREAGKARAEPQR